MPQIPLPPTDERGSVTDTGQGFTTGLLPWTSFHDSDERVPQLQWPRSILAYEKMLNDTQLKGLYLGSTLPLMRYRWVLDPNGAAPATVDRISKNYGLEIQGSDPGPVARKRGRFKFQEHLRLALKSLYLGHYPFEQVGDVADDGTWNLRKLAARPPKTLQEIAVDKDGGLRFIRQALGAQSPEIPVDRLVVYVWDQDPGNWTGKSLFRACYRNWLIKDRLLRVDAILQERAGGVPVGKAPKGATPAEVAAFSQMAQDFKVGEHSGGAVPFGGDLRIERPGTGDAWNSIRGHNEEMARSFLAMFMQLGTTATGSRALGAELIDYFALALDSYTYWFCETFNEHVIEDDVDWNEGEGAPAPLLCAERNEDPELQVADLAMLVDKGVIQVDQELEDAVRKKHDLPLRSTPRQLPPATPPPNGTAPAPPSPPATASRAERQGRAVQLAKDAGSPIPLPDRPLRRQPYEHEVKAAVDFKAMDAQFVSERDALVGKYIEARSAQVDEIFDAIKAAKGDLAKIAVIAATPVGGDDIAKAMVDMAGKGAIAAWEEAKAQGSKVAKPDLATVEEAIGARAGAVEAMLARDLSGAASRKAVLLTGGSMDSGAVAAAVKDYILGLTSGYLEEQLGGALTQAQNAGRKEVMREANPTNIYASELLDDATCENCTAIDGETYTKLEDAEADYPTGGFADCLGGARCRGTLVAVYE